MQLSSLHLLLTYQCTLECDHCFVWGSPWQTGTMTLAEIRYLLEQAESLGTVESIYFEGGEPFLYYPLMLAGVREAVQKGFQVGIVSNGYWATSLSDALVWLEPLAGLITDLSISSDLYHWSESLSQRAGTAHAAAEQLGVPVGLISVAQPEATAADASVGQLPIGQSAVMYRGRAADKLAPRVPHLSWDRFTECPHEDLREPGRVHVDPLGNLHLCQGLIIGNVFETPLKVICDNFKPESHPIISSLLQGGPADLVRRYHLTHRPAYADACHLCDSARRALRTRFPSLLGPNQMYGVGG